MKFLKLKLPFIILFFATFATGFAQKNNDEDLERKIDSILQIMTLEEKLGQLSIYGDGIVTGPTLHLDPRSTQYDGIIKQSKATGLLSSNGAAYIKRLQKIAKEETRLGIPLIFGADIIHGYRTTFPIPIAEACSWDLGAVEKAARIAATEASAAGINWTFAPMVDIARDPRWGRIAESTGEDVYLDCEIAKAHVRGFQGSDLSKSNTILACPKHFIGYGASLAGRDYNTVDMSETVLRNIYLPPFKAAIDEGALSIMSSFNDINGIPATANDYLCNQILRDEWGFKGLVLSDFASISELIQHGAAADKAEAGKRALEAGTDMDMHTSIFYEELPDLVKTGNVKEDIVDEAVRRVLYCKYKLGLFDDPYKYCDEKREKNMVLHKDHLAHAKELAKKSIVLLKNKGNALPLKKTNVKIALVGPFADNKKDMNGTWSFFSDSLAPVTFREGIKSKLGKKATLTYAKGCHVTGGYADDYDKSFDNAKSADVIIACLGESNDMNGEAASRTQIGLPGKQLEYLKSLKKTGKPIILVLTNGRPLTLEWEDVNMDAIVETWSLGTQAGHALADVLFGDYNPSGKLTVSFPRNVGQVPLYYSHMKVGRPENDSKYSSKYLDAPNSPLYPFGYGLSYTNFEYSDLALDANSMSSKDSLKISVQVKNTGEFEGEEVVQLYIQDVVGTIKRPVKELKAFKKIRLKPGQSQKVIFNITNKDLEYHLNGKFVSEPGEFIVYVGKNSIDVLSTQFQLINK